MAGRTRLAIGVRCFMASIGNVLLLVSEAKAKYMLLLISPGTELLLKLAFLSAVFSKPTVSIPPPVVTTTTATRVIAASHWPTGVSREAS